MCSILSLAAGFSRLEGKDRSGMSQIWRGETDKRNFREEIQMVLLLHDLLAGRCIPEITQWIDAKTGNHGGK